MKKAAKKDLMPGTTMTIPEWHEKASHSLSWCYIHGIITDAEYKKGAIRIDKQIPKPVREVKRGGKSK